MAALLASRFSQRFLLISSFILCSFFIITAFRWLTPSSPFEPPIYDWDSESLASSCHDFPNSADVQIIVKTGANEVYEKLPTQLLTSLRCYSNHQVLLFSDLEQEIGPRHIYDVLANVTESVKAGPEFKYYRTLQELKENRQDISTTEQRGGSAWDLDKFKFLHMMEKTWTLRPGLKWYVFIEADTYLFRSNLLLWLQRLDASKPLYLGSPAFAHDESFAHGGSGIILSGTALAQFADGDPGIAARYDEKMRKEQYGDQGLTRALRDKNVELSGRWPMIQGESPKTLPFGPGPGSDGKYWCQPLITMHHVSPDDVATVWKLEQERPDQRVCLFPTLPDRNAEIYCRNRSCPKNSTKLLHTNMFGQSEMIGTTYRMTYSIERQV